MPAILSTIISAFGVVISFFRKIFPWFNNFTTFIGGFQVLKFAKIAALTAASVVVIGLIFSFLALLVEAFTLLVDSINSVFSSLNNTSSQASCVVYWLNAFGFVDGFNLALPAFISVFTFGLLFILYKYGYNIAVKIYDVVSRVF